MNNKNISIVESIILENYQKYYKIAFTYTGNHASALDIVQESVYKAIYKSSTLKNTTYADTWIYRIVINEAKNHLKYKPVDDIDNVIIQTEDKYENIDLTNALNKISEPDKSIIILKYFEDLTLDEIAQILDINSNTIKSKLYRGLKKLREIMEVDYDER